MKNQNVEQLLADPLEFDNAVNSTSCVSISTFCVFWSPRLSFGPLHSQPLSLNCKQLKTKSYSQKEIYVTQQTLLISMYSHITLQSCRQRLLVKKTY